MKNTKETIVLMLCLSLIFSPSAVFAAPQGGKVVGGSANIHQSGATTTINQSSDRAIINWHSFDIGKNEAVRHNMPSRNSAGLHRVVGGGGASQIQGLLQSNGNVYLVNPAGVVIHKGARVDTNGFIATTRDIADSNFMKGHMVFDKPGRPDAQIINQGSISVRESGLAALVAPTVRNEGLIAGKLGKVALASGDSTWKLDMHGDDLITFTVDEKNVNALHAADGTPLAGVENSGSIKAEGGVVVLTAAQLDGIVGSVVNSGEVSAASAELKGGKITFRGQGSDVDIVNTGMVDVSSAVADGGMVRMDTDGKTRSSGTIAATGGQKGGKVTLIGREVALAGGANIDVSGNTGGGTALVGGNALGKGPERNAQKATVERGATIHADATDKGNGGQVVVWSDEKTSFDGAITARGGNEGGNGGQVETSGKSLKVGDAAQVETLAPRGLYGQWLLDPVDFVIAASGGDMTGAQLSSNLASSNVEIKSSHGHGGTNGDIFVNDAISWAANTTLTLTADRNVNVNANITAIGANAGLTITPQNGAFDLQGGKITLSGANPSLNIAGENYTVINSIQALQAINNNLGGFYAIGVDIDATETKNWNNGNGFVPIGDNGWAYDNTINNHFYGKLDGLGHNLNNLYINRPNEDHVGLFSQGQSYFNDIGYIKIPAVKNLILKNAYIIGNRAVGSIFGFVDVQYSEDHKPLIKNTILQNIKVIESELHGNDVIGGIVGGMSGCNIENVTFSGNVYLEGDGGVGGGFIGTLYKDTEIKSSSSVGTVNAGTANAHPFSAGGFVGLLNGGTIVNSFSTSEILTNSKDNSQKSAIGGFVGLIEGGTIQTSYWSGTISTDFKFDIGSFVGAIDNVSADGMVSEVNISSCYIYDKSVNDQGEFYGDDYGIGLMQAPVGSYYVYLGRLSDSQMKSKTSFQGWDFDEVWGIEEGKSYPYLRTVAASIPSTDPEPTPTPEPGVDPTPDPEPTPGTGGGTTDPGTGSTTGANNTSPSHYEMPKWLGALCDAAGGVADYFNALVDDIFNKDKLAVPEKNENVPHVTFSGAGAFIHSVTLKIPADAQDYWKDGIKDWKNLIQDGISASTAMKLKSIKEFISPFKFLKNFESTLNSVAAMVPKTYLEIDENISRILVENNFEIAQLTSDSYTVTDGSDSYRITYYLTCYEISDGKYAAAILEAKEKKAKSKFLGLGMDYIPESITITNIYNASKRTSFI